MPVNRLKLGQIVIEECGEIEERSPGYKQDITLLLAEIIELERLNATSRINIQQRITDKLTAESEALHRSRQPEG